ncbi:MotA/TolQ/ExbB proton channel family protein [Botrimarina hoheduenensis]|uniref:Colicin uptake protein TolQ n=1 Tax=Botrimarina hoheduenensis TaxID=2528000 RepID=A0A5C5VV84_9BACT|nr:MotA/TolQ/ExbB proton channel family protein [Botrimarina hoheduenensis]TWT42566.1 colicin uptake protein TolQ [Botrimarina hoheduenensis]
MQFEQLFLIIGYLIYGLLAAVAMWGAFCAILVWRRVSATRFRNEEEQDAFLDELDEQLAQGKIDKAIEVCVDDRRAMPQLALYAIENREQGAERIERQLAERFQLDVLADIEHRLSWVSTVIKSAPMVGLLGTVIGMMGAFANLSSGTKVDTGKMAEDIMFALITTALGLSIAVPLLLTKEGINSRIRKMEDLVAAGLSRLLESLRLR